MHFLIDPEQLRTVVRARQAGFVREAHNESLARVLTSGTFIANCSHYTMGLSGLASLAREFHARFTKEKPRSNPS
jgi:hypothetical protein